MTEAEIMKALECCIDEDNELITCDSCVFMECKIGKERECMYYMLKSVLDLINRKNAEIEELQDENEHLAVFLLEAKAEVERLKDKYSAVYAPKAMVRAEAIKEVWNNRPERLNEQCEGKEEFHKGWNACLDEFLDIRNHLLEEMGVEL